MRVAAGGWGRAAGLPDTPGTIGGGWGVCAGITGGCRAQLARAPAHARPLRCPFPPIAPQRPPHHPQPGTTHRPTLPLDHHSLSPSGQSRPAMASACAPACQARSLGSGTRRVVAANRWVAAAAAAGPAATAAATAAAQAVPTHASDELGTRFDAADWERFLRGYQSLYEERSFAVDAACIEGTLPPELSGTLIRNGPGLFEVGGMQISQPFDGDGLVVLFAIRDGAVRVTWRYVRTQGGRRSALRRPPAAQAWSSICSTPT